MNKATFYQAMCIAVLTVSTMIATIVPCSAQTNESKLSIGELMIHRRAIEVIVWSQPLMNYKAMRDAFFSLGANYNDVVFNSKLQNWKWQIATPNSTTPYVWTAWNLKDGPVVVEIPPSTADVGLFGTLMESWQRPLEDVGAKGKDGGRGGKYVILPPGYRGPLLPGTFTMQSQTYQGYSIMRPIIKSPTPENLAKAAAFVKNIKVYPLTDAGKPAKTRHIDAYDRSFEAIVKWDASYFKGLSDILQEEQIEERDLGYWGMAASLGIQRGVAYQADAVRTKLLDDAGAEALEVLIHLYHEVLTPTFYEGTQWTTTGTAGIFETGFTYIYPDRIAIDERGTLYYAVCTSVKNFGTATFYLTSAKDKEEQWLDGEKSYHLNVPADVPINDFWSVEVYGVGRAAWLRNVERTGRDSNSPGLQRNSDGSVDLYFSAAPPEGKKANWIPTLPGQRFFLLFRFYGPTKGMFQKTWKLSDLEEIK
jgi:hypothetical protein